MGIGTGANSLGNASILGGASATRFISLNANPTLAIAQIKNAANLTRAAAYNLSLDAYVGANPFGKITVPTYAASTTADTTIGGTYKADGGAYFAYSTDVFKLTINGKSVTTSFPDGALNTGAFNTAANTVNGGGTNVLSILEDAIVGRLNNRWNTVYGNAAAASYTESLFLTTATTSGTLVITAKAGSGRRGYDKSYSISRIAGNTTGSQATTTMAFVYGETTSPADNKMASDDIVIVIGSTIAGTVLDEVKHISITGLSLATILKLTTTLKFNVDTATSTRNDLYENEARGDNALGAGGDANLPEGGIAEVATVTPKFSRVGWLQ